jgi:hypothetical protein
MILSAALVVWSADRIIDLTLAMPDAEQAAPPETTALADAITESGATDAGRSDTGPGLRPDLFMAPRPPKPKAPPAPKTNPVELLALIELQGVLGGSRPRAMIQYKRTRETVTVSVGDDLGEFQVVEIRERSVVLKWRDELFELSL